MGTLQDYERVEVGDVTVLRPTSAERWRRLRARVRVEAQAMPGQVITVQPEVAS